MLVYVGEKSPVVAKTPFFFYSQQHFGKELKVRAGDPDSWEWTRQYISIWATL